MSTIYRSIYTIKSHTILLYGGWHMLKTAADENNKKCKWFIFGKSIKKCENEEENFCKSRSYKSEKRIYQRTGGE